MAYKVRDLWLWSDESAKNCPPNSGFKPETRTVMQKVSDLIVTSYVCVNDHPCKFIAIDIFNGKVFKATFPLSGNCVVPLVTLTDFQLVYIYEEDSQIKLEFAEGKDVFVCVGSAMGKEHIIAASRRSFLKIYTGPKAT